MDGFAMEMTPIMLTTVPGESPMAFYQRRMSDKILIVFHQACENNDLEAAERLLQLLELLTMRGPRPETGNRRLNVDSLVSAHERLWQLNNPGAD